MHLLDLSVGTMRWASLAGWKPRADGFLAHPDYATALRSSDGRWWIKADVDEGKVEMTPDGPRRAPGWFVEATYPYRWIREPDPPDEAAVERFQDALRKRAGGES